jgi:hypothetical protein
MSTAVDEPQVEGTASGEDAEKGKLFEVPRIKVILDETDPTVIKLAFSGSIDLDRTIAKDVEFYNRLRDGKEADLEITVHVAGAKTVHRRDSEGDVDAVVQTKSLTVTNVTVAE